MRTASTSLLKASMRPAGGPGVIALAVARTGRSGQLLTGGRALQDPGHEGQVGAPGGVEAQGRAQIWVAIFVLCQEAGWWRSPSQRT